MPKLLAIGNFWRGWDMSICDEEHIALAFEDVGWDVTRLQREDIDLAYLPEGMFDIVLLSQWRGYPEDVVPRLRAQYNVPIIYWAFDYQWHAGEAWHFRLAEQADLFLSQEMAHRGEYERRGVKFHWFPQDFAPDFLDRIQGIEPEYDVLFTGSCLPYKECAFRIDLIKAIDAHFNLKVVSNTQPIWQEFGIVNVDGVVIDDSLPELYAKARVNISVDSFLSEGFWSDRNAQIMCCGGFVLNKYIPMQEVIFGNTIAYFNTIDECLRKIEYYLDHPDERRAIADRGYYFAQNNLKVSHRVGQLITLLEGRGLL